MSAPGAEPVFIPMPGKPGELAQLSREELRAQLAMQGLALIPTADVNTMKFDGDLLQWPGGGMNLAMLHRLLARAGLAIVPTTDLEDLRKQVADAEVLYDADDGPSAEEREVLEMVHDVALSFGRPRHAEFEIEFMRRVNEMLRAKARRAAEEEP